MQAASAETGPNDLQKEATTGPNNLQKGARMPSQTEKWMRRIRSTKTAGRRTVRKRPGDLGRKTNPREGVQSPGVHVDEVDALRSRITRGGGSRWGGEEVEEAFWTRTSRQIQLLRRGSTRRPIRGRIRPQNSIIQKCHNARMPGYQDVRMRTRSDGREW